MLKIRAMIAWPLILCICVMRATIASAGAEIESLPDTIVKIKPAIVGIGTYEKRRRPPAILFGTGFAVTDGRHVVTNAHVIPEKIDEKRKEFLGVFSSRGGKLSIFPAKEVRMDKEHDLCLLVFEGQALAALELGDDTRVREGDLYAFTGFPLGVILGLNAATHRGIISAITPIAIPSNAIRPLDKALVNRLQAPYPVFQLDATAYPGNSGSPLYDVKTGRVIGIINKVFVKESKEHGISNPSGITYAIPVCHVKKLLQDSFGSRP
ncbi:MAG: serine protease [Desulfobacterales bacterium]|jgi:S1-C subfamily serine protease|nr:serine protease [Desulfobacterales bacterium]